MSFSLQTLTEGIRDRHVGQQNKRLVEKWSRTGLLRGMDDVNREVMATLLENQAAQVLRESNTMGSGDVGGFTNIAFPIVRRVFGGLVANELVSIQPMSLPSGLLFYLDYTYGNDAGGYASGSSIYGQPSGKDIQNGADAVGGQYDLAGSGFSKVHVKAASAASNRDGGFAVVRTNAADVAADVDENKVQFVVAAGAFRASDAALQADGEIALDSVEDMRLIQHDPQLIERITSVADGGKGENYAFLLLPLSATQVGGQTSGVANSTVKPLSSMDKTLIKDLVLLSDTTAVADNLDRIPSAMQSGNAVNLKRLTQLGDWDGTKFTPDANASLDASSTRVLLIVKKDDAATLASKDFGDTLRVSFVKADNVTVGTGGEADGTPAFESGMQEQSTAISPTIPEIDIKIESIPVTAQTRKLRARWSPELAQDLNAYHSMDAEVELTQILSEQIALEIDREILGDLLSGAKGANFFWSRSPGKFVNKRTGAAVERANTLQPGPAFTGTVREWYETLTETVIDVANEIHRKTLRGSANFIVVSPDVATILEASVLYRPSYSLDGDGQVGAPFTMGAEKIGSLSNRFTVYKDPYFPRNKILVGYKGGSYLETGFVYAPYVPLIVTPTIFQPEDFTPRKGVMTRYGKKMVRADFYGTVTCLDMNII